jgi:hypothetical protein
MYDPSPEVSAKQALRITRHVRLLCAVERFVPGAMAQVLRWHAVLVLTSIGFSLGLVLSKLGHAPSRPELRNYSDPSMLMITLLFKIICRCV